MHPYPFYYSIKPLLPWRFRYALRRIRARRLLRSCGDVWPIKESAARKPEGWPGWPDGKQFALVLTHDVESQAGLERVRQLAELEMSLGFRSSFNFVPEGSYRVPSELRNWLTANGFEVGVHGLHHDGKLYSSANVFRERARRINRYLKEWGSVGFRSPFMHHNLEWLHSLNIFYDSSTFDTDPFEPQPDGVNTIFPFWVPSPALSGTYKNGMSLSGYVELPYTLTQDITLFLLLSQKNSQIWKTKMDWVAKNGGMVLFDTHPDYLALFPERPGFAQYNANIYIDFLTHIRDGFANRYWHVLPKKLALWFSESVRKPANSSSIGTGDSLMTHDIPLGIGPPGGKTSFTIAADGKAVPLPIIWIDLDNTPHVPFFMPIIRELEKRGYKIVLTARDAFQVCELASQYELKYLSVGHHYGKNPILKLYGWIWRSIQLGPFAIREKPCLALSHGSRSQLLLANVLGIPTVLISDYEHSKNPPFCRPTYEIVPSVIPTKGLAGARILKYSGIKEDIYVPDFIPDPSIMASLGLSDHDLVVTIRPPATEAHYHNPEGESLFYELMKWILSETDSKIVLLPRNSRQGSQIRARNPGWFSNGRVVIPKNAVNGLNLIWHSDLVVSGGGTMNREAAALGVPVYSIFRGPLGSVDRYLATEGRLVLISSAEDVRSRIKFRKRQKGGTHDCRPRPALQQIVEYLVTIVSAES